jgi:hypothetical protein
VAVSNGIGGLCTCARALVLGVQPGQRVITLAVYVW